MRSAERHPVVDRGDVDVAVQRGEDEADVGKNDPRDGYGEAAEAMAVERVECAEVGPAREVEEVDAAVGEAGGEVLVGERQVLA